ADDSAATSVKVGYRQACYTKKPPSVTRWGFFYVWRLDTPLVLSAYAALSRPTPACAGLRRPTSTYVDLRLTPVLRRWENAGRKKAALCAASVI
ncbi:hypothetical protein, partial [Janthinobacterium sp. HH103]|uniref:hypothetical protein n=1 Tax=Janthinobacterium sp. HH103 TaxID=1537275 RepID=UPI001C2FCF2B